MYYAAADWPSSFVLPPGRIGVEIDTYKFKIGTGADEWADIVYAENEPAWIRLSVSSLAPAETSYGVAKIKWLTRTVNSAIIIDHALFEKGLSLRNYFDGTLGQEDVSGLIWEGDPNESRSLLYENYAAVNASLKQALRNQLIHGSSFALIYEAE